jgi:hypothetical protein
VLQLSCAVVNAVVAAEKVRNGSTPSALVASSFESYGDGISTNGGDSSDGSEQTNVSRRRKKPRVTR